MFFPPYPSTTPKRSILIYYQDKLYRPPEFTASASNPLFCGYSRTQIGLVQTGASRKEQAGSTNRSVSRVETAFILSPSKGRKKKTPATIRAHIYRGTYSLIYRATEGRDFYARRDGRARKIEVDEALYVCARQRPSRSQCSPFEPRPSRRYSLFVPDASKFSGKRAHRHVLKTPRGMKEWDNGREGLERRLKDGSK